MRRFSEVSEFLAPNAQEWIFGNQAMHSARSAQGEILLHRVVNESAQANPESLFVAQQGARFHGLDFLEQVLKAGCQCLLSDRPANPQERAIIEQFCLQNQCSICLWVLVSLEIGNAESQNSSFASAPSWSEFSSWFYHHPSKRLKVIGITGTNGKTSSAFYTAQLLKSRGFRVGVIGTLGNGLLDNLQPTLNTTPDAIRLQDLLNVFAEQGIEYVVMEVSSHAITLARVAAVEFFATAITQIGSDHLDFHGTQEAYASTKLRLFTEFSAQHQVFNFNDERVQKFCESQAFCNLKATFWGYQIKSNDFDCEFAKSIANRLSASEVVLSAAGIQFRLQQTLANNASDTPSNSQSLSVTMPLMGRFNLENVLCALSIVQACEPGCTLLELAAGAEKLQAVPGRMQRVHCKPNVIVDFAHTADGLQHLLQAVVAHNQKHATLWVVFGCGGDRDRSKRPQMAKVAEQFADQIMVTSDNPRTENPQTILDEIMVGFEFPERVHQQLDRTLAIEEVLAQAASDDIVVIAGKGHESYQEIKGQKLPFSDQAVVENFFNSQTRQREIQK